MEGTGTATTHAVKMFGYIADMGHRGFTTASQIITMTNPGNAMNTVEGWRFGVECMSRSTSFGSFYDKIIDSLIC